MRALPILVAALCLAVPALAQVNDCTDPYWADTLRCKAFPGEVPQPNLADVPTSIQPFTRVFLDADPDIRCADGTTPVMYVDRALDATSNKWIFSVTGGGSDAPVDSDLDGDYDDAQAIVEAYLIGGERDGMGTATKPPMMVLNGVNAPYPLRNPVFANYNRVRVDKCSFDRFMGRAAYGLVNATTPGGLAVEFELWQQGYLIVLEAFDKLATGLTYTTWVEESGEIVEEEETLQPLSSAEQILIVGHSGGAHGLYHNIDNLAADLATITTADVRAVFDANFIPSNENEAWFDTTTPGNDAYSGTWSGSSLVAGGTFTYDGPAYWPGSFLTAQYTAWAAQLDASCLAAHSADAWKCSDRMHVLFNHIAAPFFVREDFTDPNPEHTNGGAGHTVLWGSTAAVFTACTAAPPDACYPVLNVAEYRQRLEQQFATLADDARTRSEMATGADTTLGAGNFPSMTIWMPQCGTHSGAYYNNPFFETTISYLGRNRTMREMMEEFMTLDRMNQKRWAVDDWSDGGGNLQETIACF